MIDSSTPLTPRRVRRTRGLHGAITLTTLVCGLLVSGVAHAHRNSIGYSTLEVAASRTEVAYKLELEPVDVAEMLGLDPDEDPSDEAIRAGAGRLLDGVLAHIDVLGDGEICPVERIGARPVREGERFVELLWRARCARPIDTLAVEYDLFFDLDPAHQGFLRAVHGDQTAQVILSADASRFVWNLAAPPPKGRLDFLEKGIEHILHGFDHIAFLFGLLLVVTILWSQEPKPGWQQRNLVAGLRYTATIVTSFTLAHSLTLIAASLGWISLPGALVESIIAASIVYVAVEDIIKPETRYRFVITFAFGLVHGLGFASQLQVYLPAEDVIVPLVLFNVGVELGQLAIVICVLPLLHGITRLCGARLYRTRIMPAGSVVLVVLGLLWLIERVFSVEILGF